MSRAKETRTQSTVHGGIQRFDLQAGEAGTLHLNGRVEYQALGGFWNALIPAESDVPWESPKKSDQQACSYDAGMQDSRMTLALFVETKFVPEHVQYKTPAGQTHYQAMLKHVLTPEAVSRIFDPDKAVKLRLRAVGDWPYLDSIRLCDLRSEHIRRIVAAADKAGYSTQTVKHIKNVCFAIIAHAQKEGCFSGPNPASLVKLPTTTRSAAPGLTLEQIHAILNQLHHPFRDVVLFALTTGLSLPEICDLRWKNLNLDDFDRFVDGEFLRARTVLVKSWWNRGSLGDSRTCHKSKIIDLREPLLSNLREMWNQNPTPDAEDYILVSPDGSRIIPASLRGGEMKRVGKAVGLPSLSWQDFRRTHRASQTHSLSQQPLSLSFNPRNTPIGRPLTQSFLRHKPLCEDKIKSASSSRRTFCFGRRTRAGWETGVSLDNHNKQEPTWLTI